jgi:arylsulfatase A-like enzyme
MVNPYNDQARKDFLRSTKDLAGKPGEYPRDRAEKRAAEKNPAVYAPYANHHAEAPEEWAAAPARQVSNKGNVRK